MLAVVSGCGSDDGGLTAADERSANDGSEQEGTTDETDAMTSQWIRIESDPEVTQYQPAQPVEVLAHPNKAQAILVRFMMPQPPCSGARVRTAESASTIAVALELGLHRNVAAMSCLATEGQFELEVALEAPVANRSIQAIGAATGSTIEPTASTTEPSSTTTQPDSTETTTRTSVPTETSTSSPNESQIDLVGRPIEEASAIAIDRGLTVRVMRLDGEDLMGTMDYRTDRVNVEVADGVVVAILGIG